MYDPSLMLCSACGSLVVPVKRHKGSIAVEAVLLLTSILAAFVSFPLGGLIFVVFLVYCVWRLTSKHQACEICNATQLIPANSPLAQQLLADRTKFPSTFP